MKQLLITIAAVVLVGCGPNIHEATWTGNIELIKQLTDSNIDVNVKRDRGETPLHIAAIFSRYQIAKLLISKGADVNARNDDGFTPLLLLHLIDIDEERNHVKHHCCNFLIAL